MQTDHPSPPRSENDKATYEILNVFFDFINATPIENRVELLHQWLLDYISLHDNPCKEIILQYEELRNLMIKIQSIKEKFNITLFKSNLL